ncbi:hypothetical protein [Streptomyces anulatus]|uniref:hypothetical protein n=1 Tax=Streptomyces anulatus TaxID=1892 RepID=UPI0004C682FB|nr:hypothetical protein [Streptomyces anulatus]
MRKDPSSPKVTVRRRACLLIPARRPAGLADAAVALLLLAVPGVAWADEMESEEAPVLVEQAIALIANDAGEERVAERIQDALEAPDKEGVDLSLVGKALDVVERPGQDEANLREARELLLKSLDGKLPSAPAPGRFATATETGTSVVLDEFRPARGIADAGDATLLALALAVIVLGLWLSVRLRPPHSIRELERRSNEEGGRDR